MVVIIGGIFDHRHALEECVHQPPTPLPAVQGTLAAPGRWTLKRIRQACPFLQGYSLPGVWKVLKRAHIGRRLARHQQYSPDPDYLTKRAHLVQVLTEAAEHPDRRVVLFGDQMGYRRWPQPSHTWAMQAPAPPPVADRAASKEGQWRLMGALNAMTGQVHYLDNYILGRQQVIAFIKQLDRAYPTVERISLVLDNWSIHSHPDVLAALEQMPRVELVWLPTYAPWLNPIEKLWRMLRQELLCLHHLASDWKGLQAAVRRFLDQFASGSLQLLSYVGLRGQGFLATALRRP